VNAGISSVMQPLNPITIRMACVIFISSTQHTCRAQIDNDLVLRTRSADVFNYKPTARPTAITTGITCFSHNVFLSPSSIILYQANGNYAPWPEVTVGTMQGNDSLTAGKLATLQYLH